MHLKIKTGNQGDNTLTKTNYSAEGLHQLLLDRNKPTIDVINTLAERMKKKEIADTTYSVWRLRKKAKRIFDCAYKSGQIKRFTKM